MVPSLLVLALLVVAPTVARAGWSVEPPKGWTRSTAEHEAAVQKEVQIDDPSVTDVRIWDNEDELLLLTFGSYADPRDVADARTLRVLVAREADAMLESFWMPGHRVERKATRATRDRPESATRVLVSRDERLHLAAFAVTDGAGRVQVFSIQCRDTPRGSACKRALESVSFVRDKL